MIRAFRKEADETAAFDRDNDALTAAQNFVGRISALLNPLTYVLINGAILVLLWTGAIRVEAGLLTQGTVVALYNYMSQILVELIKLANLIINVTRSVACGNRIQSVLELPPAADAAGGELPAASPGHPAGGIPRCDPALPHGQRPSAGAYLAGRDARGNARIIGGTSAGKTSLVNLVPRFYDASEGQVLVDGADVQTLPATVLRQRIGVVPQQAVLFAGSIRDNLRWGDLTAPDEVLWQALETAQAKAVVEDKPGGLDFRLEQGGRNLSGGQRQRLTIARALVRRPDILILDDSAAALGYAH